MKKYAVDYGFLFGIAGLIILIDQITKQIVRTNLIIGQMWAPELWMLKYARIVHWKNTGAAFGIFQDFGMVFTILAIIVSIAIVYYFPQVDRRDRILRLAMALQLAGAMGNLIDRLTQGWVTDFISIGNFAVFNVADASISIGVVTMVIGMWLKDKEQKQLQKLEAEDAPAESPAGPRPEEIRGE